MSRPRHGGPAGPGPAGSAPQPQFEPGTAQPRVPLARQPEPDAYPVWDRESTAERPTVAPGWRPNWRPDWRPGPIGIAIIVASVLAAFGLGAALLSPLFAAGGGTSTATPAQPGAAAPVIPSDPSAGSPSAGPTASPSATPSRTTDVVTGDTGAENAVVTLVNKERSKAHCKPVRNDGQLHAAAVGHSADMAAHNYFDHDSQDGRSFADRIREAGYDAPLSENIAKGFRTPQQVMDGWMRSKEHKANILNCNAKAIGVGLAVTKDGTAYWTQDFGRQ